MENKRKVFFAILDGFGLRNETIGNAVALAKKPTYDYLMNNFPNTTLRADGENVGLPKGQMGNSEVGHTNIGAGRIVYQSLTLINKAIEEKTFNKNEQFLKAIEHAKENNSNLHVMGLFSKGGVHSHLDHFKALIDFCKINNFENIYFHLFTDGRDVGFKSAAKDIKEFKKYLNKEKIGQIASISGRYYAMDRDKRWERTKLTYQALTGEINNKYSDEIEYINQNYKNDINDEFIKPAFNSQINVKISDNDSVIFTNFRPDRAIQLSKLFSDKKFSEFEYKKLNNIYFVTMMKYPEIKSNVAFSHQKLVNTLGEFLEKQNLKQLRIAETEKYPHVTFFFDGGVEKEMNGKHQILVPSPKDVATYDLKPEMSAEKVKDELINFIKENEDTNVVILNFANPDMVGHSGNLDATIKAVETVDKCLGEILDFLKDKKEWVSVVTADHGNAETLITKEGNPMTSHTTNPVPFIINDKNIELKSGILADISPTIIDLLGLEKPKEMLGKSLIVKK